MIPSSHDSAFSIVNKVIPHVDQAEKNNLAQWSEGANIVRLLKILLDPLNAIQQSVIDIQAALPIDYVSRTDTIVTSVNTGTSFDTSTDVLIGTSNISLLAWFRTTNGSAEIFFPDYPKMDMTVVNGKLRVEFSIDSNNRVVTETDAAVDNGILHSAIAFIDRSNQSISISIDGVLEATTDIFNVGDIGLSLDTPGRFNVGADADLDGQLDGTFFGLGMSLNDNLIEHAVYLHNNREPITWDRLEPIIQEMMINYWQMSEFDVLNDSVADNYLISTGVLAFTDQVALDTLTLLKRGAYGDILDLFGAEVGIKRTAGQGDLIYKDLIHAQVLENSNQGTIDEFLIIMAAKLRREVKDKVAFATEVFPAQIHATVAGVRNVLKLGEIKGVSALTAAGVGSAVNVFPDTGCLPFGCEGSGGAGLGAGGENNNGCMVARYLVGVRKNAEYVTFLNEEAFDLLDSARMQYISNT